MEQGWEEAGQEWIQEDSTPWTEPEENTPTNFPTQSSVEPGRLDRVTVPTSQPAKVDNIRRKRVQKTELIRSRTTFPPVTAMKKTKTSIYLSTTLRPAQVSVEKMDQPDYPQPGYPNLAEKPRITLPPMR